MAWFFSDVVSVPLHEITGEDALHISRSLRMKVGEPLSICDENHMQFDCVIDSVKNSEVTVHVLDYYPCRNEPPAFVTLYQSLTKGDKMEFIIQKAVELGISEIVPVLTARCVSRPDEKSMKKKLERWNKIARQAAMQSRRAFVPTVKPVISLEDAARQAGSSAIVCYELGGLPLGQLLENRSEKISLFIGSEGGFEQSEIEIIKNNGGSAATLGNRILRAETAPIAAISVIMYLTGGLGSTNDISRSDNGTEIKGGNWNAFSENI